jgi:oligopeptide transport system substrate-binding protein
MKVRIALLTVGALAACSSAPDDRPITVSVIGGTPKFMDPVGNRLDAMGALTMAATAQGLVAFDASGGVIPALAERWIVTSDGLSVIFRIRRTVWADGREVSAKEVATSLTRAVVAQQRNSRTFAGIEQIVAMTGQVIEVRLSSPQPALLQLFAQPEMAIFRARPSVGTGPYRLHSVRAGVTRFRLAPVMIDGSTAVTNDRDDVRVRGEGASLAVARFAAGDAMLVIGGDFTTLPYASAARISATEFRVDPAYGLFGLAVVGGGNVPDNVQTRTALAMAIDRDRLVQRFGVNRWRAVQTLLPAQFDGMGLPSGLGWVGLPQAERRVRARAAIANQAALPVLRVALPEGPGAKLLFASIAADWAAIGVTARAVPLRSPADLVLIDEVAPQSGALWYFDRVSCARGLVCDAKAEAALKDVMAAPTIEARTKALLDADVAFALHQGFIPLALPLRWSLAKPSLTAWQPSGFAIHPLIELRAPPS